MKLHTAVQDQAVLSNVGTTGEFRIRNSAKAFNILSSGLYANKIRAVIRELSCNAVDSHVAAGRVNTPFDVHLPTVLEPWFSVRDYGTGLSHEQVTNIYTTYFESTKTASNDFIGALGLGSKSPFSYTTNFTVTAIQAGRKGIYAAFINDAGVPSIALMSEQALTDEPTGVEVRFSVDDTGDFARFRSEARQVYTWFQLQPVVHGGGDHFEIPQQEYLHRDLVPGVHQRQARGGSMAVMGNIAYPIDVPNSDQALGDLRYILNEGLEMHFGIGELDFQASREGLSYIPETVAAIRGRLEALRDAMLVTLRVEADAIDNAWDRALFLNERYSSYLWRASVQKYCQDTKFPLFNPSSSSWERLTRFDIPVDALAAHNIQIRSFTYGYNSNSCSISQPATVRSQQVGVPDTKRWEIRVDQALSFVVNDTRTGATERAKYHWRNSKNHNQRRNHQVYVLEPVDRKLPMQLDTFWQLLRNPPQKQRMLASSLQQRPRDAKQGAGPVSIMVLQEVVRGYYNRNAEATWRPAGNTQNFDRTVTHYYLPLSGLTCVGRTADVKSLYTYIANSGIMGDAKIYGVRKSDIETVRKMSNWVNLDDEIQRRLINLDTSLMLSTVKQTIDWESYFCYNAHKHVTDPNSVYLQLYQAFAQVRDVKNRSQVLTAYQNLGRIYKTGDQSVSLAALEFKYLDLRDQMLQRYPLLKHMRTTASGESLAQYINLVDASQGVSK